MVSTQNTRRSHVNAPRMQDQQGNTDIRPPVGALETIHDNTNEMEAFHLTNQRLIWELKQLTRQRQRPREVRQAQEGHNITPQEEQPHFSPPREAKVEAKSNSARGHELHLTPRKERNEAILGGTLKTMNRPLLSKEWGSDHGSRGSRVSNRNSAT